MKNPFTPNFGQEPIIIAGRKDIMEELDQAFTAMSDASPMNSIFIGASGTGKTAMLTHYGRKLSKEGWIIVNVSCANGMLEDIHQQTLKNAQHLLKEDGNTSVRFEAPFIDIQVPNGKQGFSKNLLESNWQIQMTDIIADLNSQGAGLLITIDELNPRPEEMAEFLHLYQKWRMEKRKIALLIAGLPNNISSFLIKEKFSDLRNFKQYMFNKIPDNEIHEAFEATVKLGGKEITPTALQKAVGAINGYSFMFQLVGYRSFFYAGDKKIITRDDIANGIKAAVEDLKIRTLKPALDGLSDIEIQFLKAMSQDGETSSVADIAERLGKSKSSIHVYKNKLFRQGIIQKSEPNAISFSLPNLRGFLEEYRR